MRYRVVPAFIVQLERYIALTLSSFSVSFSFFFFLRFRSLSEVARLLVAHNQSCQTRKPA